MFKPKATNANNNLTYKTLYISENILKDVEHYANQNDISLNSMIVQMIEYCLEELKNKVNI